MRVQHTVWVTRGRGVGAGGPKMREGDKQEPCQEIWTLSWKPQGFKPEVILSPWGYLEKVLKDG